MRDTTTLFGERVENELRKLDIGESACLTVVPLTIDEHFNVVLVTAFQMTVPPDEWSHETSYLTNKAIRAGN